MLCYVHPSLFYKGTSFSVAALEYGARAQSRIKGIVPCIKSTVPCIKSRVYYEHNPLYTKSVVLVIAQVPVNRDVSLF